MTLGKKLKALRAEHNLSQPELAEKIGIEQSYLSKLENDKSVPSNDIFNNILQAFSFTLEAFVSDFPLGTELERLKQIPDIERYFSAKQKINHNHQRRFLYVSSLLIVLATTLFYSGFSKQLFSETQYQYESDGVLKDSEDIDTLRNWHSRLTRAQRMDQDLVDRVELEIIKRRNEETLALFGHKGPYFRIDLENGYRYYILRREKNIPRRINAWLQVLGVLLFSAGIMGFVLERRLFKVTL